MNISLHHIDEYKVFEWQLDNYLGNGFEREIFQIINKQIADKFNEGVRIFQTPVGPDGGKDIIIQTPVPLCVLNQKFNLVDKKEIKIYVECKSSDKKRIDLTKVASSFMRVKENNVDYYMLVSNSSFAPQTLYILKSDFESAGIKFKVVDQYLLCKAIHANPILKKSPQNIDLKLYYDYQISTTRVENRNAYEIFFCYRNLENEDQLVTQRLLTDNNWSIDETEKKFFVNANGVYTNKFMVIQNFADGIEDLIFSVENNGSNEKQIKIEGTGIRPIFEPPFFGTDHKNCESFLVERIIDADTFDLCCIWGEAGIGKTRIFNEVYKKLNGQNFDFLSVTVRQNNNFIDDIKKFLQNKNYIPKNKQYDTLKDMLLASKNEYMRAVILIDDCHNISNQILDDIKCLIGMDIPITIVLCGRTDYSVGTNDYYNFVHYTENEQKIGTWQLAPFSDEDTKSFISLIIARIPEVALNKIWKMSNNNPLFIIHFIEYLLELNIVELYNRSSVGVINVNTFNSHLYIPNKVEEIYKKRVEYLRKKEYDAEHLLKYFYILSILQDKQAKEIALKYIEEDRLNFLIQRRFLNYSENGDVIFSHESFALFVRHTLEKNTKLKKELANEFFSNLKYLLEFVTKPDIGVLALWAGKKSLAAEYLGNIIEDIEKTTNQSSFNVDFSISKYLTYIMELYKSDKKHNNFLIKIIKTKIYTSIHHFSPIIAINVCDEVLDFINKNKMLKNNKSLNNSVIQQKAHAMIIAGYMVDAELLMKRLLSEWLMDQSVLDDETLFDLLDRFCGIYIDSNCKELALNFNEMSKKQKIASDKSLNAIAYLNTAKIHFLSDYEIAERSFLKVQDLLTDGESKRIYCSSKISLLMISLLHRKREDYGNMIEESYSILKEAIDGNYVHSTARIYLVLAVLHLLIVKNTEGLYKTRNFINKGINYSVKFGFQREVWEFYNLLGIVQLRQGIDSEEIRQTFVTAFSLLQKHDYLNLGMRDLCCDNILVLSNIGFFYQSKKTEKEFYDFMSKITFWRDSTYYVKEDNTQPNDFLRKEYLKARHRQLLFTKNPNNNLLRDEITGYFIALS